MLKISYLEEKIVQISLKLNFTPKTLGCYGLRYSYDFPILVIV